MSARHTFLTHMIERLCSLAVQLGREDAGFCRTLAEITADARELLAAGDAARRALDAKRSPKTAYARAVKVAKLYKAATVERGDLAGMVLGMRFSSGAFSSGSDHVFFIA